MRGRRSLVGEMPLTAHGAGALRSNGGTAWLAVRRIRKNALRASLSDELPALRIRAVPFMRSGRGRVVMDAGSRRGPVERAAGRHSRRPHAGRLALSTVIIARS